ncbi:MAG: hypothetical protein R2745_24980 [Vicinamibacterales bacterium]
MSILPPTSSPRGPGLGRRQFVHLPLAGLVGAALPAAAWRRVEAAPAGSAEWLPRQDPTLVQQVVGASHSDLARVRELVERQPALARGAIDWGFGDWESALGAASHTGRREIAEFLLAHGARPTLFSAAMLGQLAVVRAFVESSPGIQRIPGPHAIPLLQHARAGGDRAAEVYKYLESVGGADERPPTEPLTPADRDAIVGRYVFGEGSRDRFDVEVVNDRLGIQRPEGNRQLLFHAGGLVFYPSGVPTVRIAFTRAGQRISGLTVADPDVLLSATRA